MKILILDMDGTVRIKKGAPIGELSSGFIANPKDQEIIPGAKKAIEDYLAKDWLIIGASNQGGVAAGKKSLEHCFQEQLYTLSLESGIHKILFCPDYEGKHLGVVYRSGRNLISPTGYSSFRKPSPGMLEYILLTHEADEVLFVGDRPEDEAAAQPLNIPFQWAKDWWQ